MKNIAIIGSGGHANSLIDLIESSKKFKVIGYFDKEKNRKNKYKYLGKDFETKKYNIKLIAMGIGLGIKPQKKLEIINKYKKLGFYFPSLIHKNSIISKNSKLEEGTQIFSGTIINTNSRIKSHSVINTGSIIVLLCSSSEDELSLSLLLLL